MIIKGEKITVHLTPDAETKVKLSDELSLNTEAIYLDDPFVLDEPRAVLGIFSSRFLWGKSSGVNVLR